MTRLRMQDIAERAGVSQPTVSLVLSGRRDVRISEGTRQRILEVARAMNYRRDGTARNLAAGSTHAVAFVYDATAVFLLDDPFCRGILSGIIEATQAANLSLLFSVYDHHSRSIPAVENRLVDGVLYLAAKSAEALEYLAETKIPYVILNPDVAADTGTTIALADRAAGTMAARAAIRAGYRKALFVLPSWQGEVPPSYADRAAGFQKALPQTRELILPRSETHEASYEVGLTAAAQVADEPLVVCANDQMAWGLLDGLAAAGVSVPGDVSVIGFDGLDREHDPHNRIVSSVSFDRAAIGQDGLTMLRSLIDGEKPSRRLAAPQWREGATLAMKSGKPIVSRVKKS